jgi:hypothetical protein
VLAEQRAARDPQAPPPRQAIPILFGHFQQISAVLGMVDAKDGRADQTGL